MQLIKKGWSAKEVASSINLTQAAISQYKSKKRGTQSFGPKVQKQIEISADLIIKGKRNINLELSRLAKIVKTDGTVCKLHLKKANENKSKLPCQGCEYG